MMSDQLGLSRRREALGLMCVMATVAAVLVVVYFWIGGLSATHPGLFILFLVVGWLSALGWIKLDTAYRGMRSFWWVLLVLASTPYAYLVALLFYFLCRHPAKTTCSQCGSMLVDPLQVCSVCGRQSHMGRLRKFTDGAYRSLADSLVNAPIERSRQTTQHMILALVAASVFGLILSGVFPEPLRTLLRLLYVFSVAAYWVLLPWWVYLDAGWRKMDATPWAILTLVTNVFGLVTYLVIRHPDPRLCPQCGKALGGELKRCPYCGSEAEPACPRCQAPVRLDWLYCPACAVRLPTAQLSEATFAAADAVVVTIRGSVTDALTGSPVAGAEVKIDARDDERHVITDGMGRFLLTELEPRPYVLVVSASGYCQQSQCYSPAPAGAEQLHFSLNRSISS